MPDAETACQLYAVVETGEAASQRLAAALGVAEIASVLIVPAAGKAPDLPSIKALVALARRSGAAALVAGDAQLARKADADGVHVLSAPDDAAVDLMDGYQTARGALGPDGVIGIDPGISRHDAMSVAEAGADYVAFGAPGHLKDRDKAKARRDELVAWWAEIFQVPCVAFDVETAEEAQALAEAGADFVAVTLDASGSPAATGEHVAALAAAIRLHAPAG